jgi:cytochrome c
MDSFEINKIAGAVIGVVLFAIGASAMSDVIVSPATPAKPGYSVATTAAPVKGGAAPAAAVEADKPIAALLASADAAKGADVFKKCASCHTADKGGPNKVGPNLYNIVDRARGSVAGFNYSAPLKASAEKNPKWDYEGLNAFLKNPKGAISGTAMAFAGIPNADQRADLIAYLRGQAETPAALPK